MSEYNIQMNKYNALNAGYDQLYPQPMKHANTHAKDGSDPITPASIGARPDTWTPTATEVGAIPTSASCNKNWNWSGQSGQPSWLWGGEDGTNMYVYNPANFSVNYATSANYANGAGNADTVDGWNMNLAYDAWGIKPICAGTGGMTAGSTGLSTGHVYLQFE